MSLERKIYLGDAVYAEFDGFGVMLTTDNGEEVSNSIYMEPVVIEKLEKFYKSWQQPTEG